MADNERKVAEQLTTAGFTSLGQLASLDPGELEDDGHPLHSLRARIAKDDWIAQARELLGD